MTDSNLNIQTEEKNEITIIHLNGTLDANTTPELDGIARSLVASGKVKLVFDLQNLSFISSAGLGLLSALRKQCKNGGGDVRISRPTREVLDVFELLSFSKLFHISHNLEDSLKDY